MATQCWIVLAVITIFCGLVVGIELKLESDVLYYNCYRKMEFRSKANNYMCQGKEDDIKCKSCYYYKQWQKKVKKNE